MDFLEELEKMSQPLDPEKNKRIQLCAETMNDKLKKAREEFQQNKSTKRLTFSAKGGSRECDPEEITDIFLGEDYNGDMPDLWIYENTKYLSIIGVHSWIYYADHNYFWLKSLSITVGAQDKPSKIEAINLERLTIYFKETDENKRDKITIDFSGIPYLEELCLYDLPDFNYTCLTALKKLK